MTVISEQVAEYHGLYGAINIPESVIQEIWDKQQFSQNDLKSSSGKTLKIIKCGRKNNNEGPDFREAVIEVEGQRVLGDIEIHLYPEGWYQHKHHLDPNFKNVLLHVFVFPPKDVHYMTLNMEGDLIEDFSILPHLDNDLEAYDHEQSLLKQASYIQDIWVSLLERYSWEEVIDQINEHARKRYQQKVNFAKLRIAKYGWDEACHQYFLEALGYSRNRSAMSNIALVNSLGDFAKHSVDELYNQQKDYWLLSGFRPHNQPKKRLTQYLDLLQNQPKWPTKLLHWGSEFESKGQSDIDVTTKIFRNKVCMGQLNRKLQDELLCKLFGGTRIHTLCCDAFLPLLAAYRDWDSYGLWYHWYQGDFSNAVATQIKLLKGHGDVGVSCNGIGQGVLGYMLSDS